MKNNVIIACDFDTEAQLDAFLSKFGKTKPFIKIGYQMFYNIGTKGVKKYKDRGYKIFLDLKLHDIPNTVQQGVKSLSKLKVDMLSIHAGGGLAMMQAAMKYAGNTKIVAVTLLTSITENILRKDLMIYDYLKKVVIGYAKNAKLAGVDGVVCSALESKELKENIKGLITVCPGIRYGNGDKHDQKRTATPKQAKANKCDYIVVGRAITKSNNPLATYNKILKEFN